MSPSVREPRASNRQLAAAAALAALLALAGCARDGGSSCPDVDGDGFPASACGGTDCDDAKAWVHPGMTDLCGDGVDQDCAGGDPACPCDDGEITARCLCAGAERTSGFCCGEAHQATACPSPVALWALPADRATAWSPGVRGGIPSYTTVHATVAAAPGDMRATIQAALDAAGAAASPGDGRVVALGPGVFTIHGPLSIPSHVVLRGAGLDARGEFRTRLRSSAAGFTLVNLGDDAPSFGASVSLATDAPKGGASVTLVSGAAAAGFAAGQLALLDEVTDGVVSLWSPQMTGPARGWFSRNDRPIAEVLEVEAVSGGTVTFRTPIHIGMRTGQAAQLTRIVGTPTRLAGVEELRLTTAWDPAGDYGYERGNVVFGLAVDCWARHFEADGSAGRSVGFRLAHRCEVREGYLHDTQFYRPGGWGYGVDVTFGSSNNLVEDDIVIRFNKVTNFRGAGGGNVVGYAYADDGAISYSPGWIETGLQASHYPTPHFELFEGNSSFNADGDDTAGNAVFITFFRNHLSGRRALTRRPAPNAYGAEDPVLVDEGNLRCAGAMSGHRAYSFAANVLGWPGMTGFAYEAPADEPLRSAIWHVGAVGDGTWSSVDPAVGATMLRDGNFDYAGGRLEWHGIGNAGSSAAPMPRSLYLSAKPAFFGARRWPWVEAQGVTKLYTLPARARYESGFPNVVAP